GNSILRNRRKPALLLDESSHCTRRAGISQRARRFAGAHFIRRRSSFGFPRARRKQMTISAVLLAGGKSRRMGEDKATVLFQDMPLWEIQLDLLRKLQPDELFISAQSDPPWRPADVQFVADEQ